MTVVVAVQLGVAEPVPIGVDVVVCCRVAVAIPEDGGVDGIRATCAREKPMKMFIRFAKYLADFSLPKLAYSRN